MQLEIVIVTWNSRNEIADCLRGLGTCPPNWRVTVVDNNSSDGTPDLIQHEFPSIRLIINPDNRGFAKANNQVITSTDSEYVLLLNPDTVATVDTIQRAIEKLASLPAAGAIGAKILNNDGSLQPSCQRFPSLGGSVLIASGLHELLPEAMLPDLLLADRWDHDTERKVDSICGAFMLVKREAIKAAGPIPDEYFLYYEETDWCYQFRKHGFEVWFTPDLSIMHHGNKSGSQNPPEWRTTLLYESKYKFCRHNYGPVTTKAIQAVDLVGYTLRKWYYSIFSSGQGNREKLKEMQVSQAIAQRCLMSK